MANLTITVDPETLKRARIRALERGESVNAYLARMLERYAADSGREHPLAQFGALADQYDAGSGPEGRSWTRDELHRYP